jgi:hypothetical protein
MPINAPTRALGLRWAPRPPPRPFPDLRRSDIRSFSGNSDWVIGIADQEIQLELLAGWATGRQGDRSTAAPRYRQLADKTKGRGQRTRFNDARGSCRLFCNADCDPLIRQVAIEQDIVLDLVHADLHPMGLIGPFERR